MGGCRRKTGSRRYLAIQERGADERRPRPLDFAYANSVAGNKAGGDTAEWVDHAIGVGILNGIGAGCPRKRKPCRNSDLCLAKSLAQTRPVCIALIALNCDST